MQYDLCIVIPTYNRKQLLMRCLNSLKKQSQITFKIIVVDDGSKDGTGKMINTSFPDIDVINGTGSLFWTGAINTGIKYSIKSYNPSSILITNDDTNFKNEYINNIIDCGKKFPNAIIGSPTIVDTNKGYIIDNGGEILSGFLKKLEIINSGKLYKGSIVDLTKDVDRLTGRGVLIPIKVFKKIGYYDDRHFLQCGDTEFTIRAKNAGYRLLINYNSPVVSFPVYSSYVQSGINHRNSYSIGQIFKYFTDVRSNANIKYLFFYNYTLSNNIAHFIVLLCYNILGTLYGFLKRVKI